MIRIRKALPEDHQAVWEILQSIILGGDTFAFSPSLTKEEMLLYWFAKDKHVYVALDENEIAGTFFIKDNQPGLGSHIANAAYAVSPGSRGKGIGKIMGEFSLKEAKQLGYTAMQFNLVVKTNTAAVKLWRSIGFEIIGEIPNAFNHREHGLVNSFIMYKKL
ncbi:MAG TPA: N-acetyltransferase [Bacteroidia bacterium]|nr:N-acetyltransferase [Bacteroidia bacterium]